LGKQISVINTLIIAAEEVNSNAFGKLLALADPAPATRIPELIILFKGFLSRDTVKTINSTL
jgi:hypothetical protein